MEENRSKKTGNLSQKKGCMNKKNEKKILA
jgi:hypothetical protein